MNNINIINKVAEHYNPIYLLEKGMGKGKGKKGKDDMGQHGEDVREFQHELKNLGKGKGKGKGSGKDDSGKGKGSGKDDSDKDDSDKDSDDEGASDSGDSDSGDSDSDMQIFVKTPEAKTITLDVETSNTIAIVKVILKNLLGIQT